MSTEKGTAAASPATSKLSPSDNLEECCRARGASYRDPMHTHVCTIVLTDDPDLDEHESHACWCGDWWHDR